ncbi:hypothetical protein MsAg5_01090 [Methanosarcinaceae archaeon Ag5]|uniref:DNA-binding protein MutS2 n=2 Tax=Methanolapillus africanus TaxID=3028297 RepID=A0AAE4MGP7_9EURY|nr:hypothetical protein [Methanosarcinaceae archaeon Ag5]
MTFVSQTAHSKLADARTADDSRFAEDNSPADSEIYLRDIAGIGTVLEKRLTAHFGSEDKAVLALLNGDVAELCKVEGLTKKAATSLVLNASREQSGVCAGDFLKTKEAESLYLGILKILKKYCHTSFASDYMDRLIPYPSQRMDLANAVSDKIRTHLHLIESLTGDEKETIAGLLSHTAPIKATAASKIKDKAVLAFSEKTYLIAKEKFGRQIGVYWVTDPQECADYFAAYTSVILFEFPEFDLPDSYDYFRDVDNTTIEQLAPEISLDFFIQNQKTLTAGLKLTEILAAGSDSGTFCGLSAEDALHLRTLMSKIDASGNFAAGADAESDRLNFISKNSDEIFLRESIALSKRIEETLAATTLTLDGAQMMKVMSGVDLREIVSEKISKNYREYTSASLSEISSSLSLKKDEEILIYDLFGDEIRCPISIDQDAVIRFKKHISAEMAERTAAHKKKLSKELAGQKEICESIISAVLEFDVWYSAAGFASAHNMTFAKTDTKAEAETETKTETKTNPNTKQNAKSAFFLMTNARNLFLSQKYGFSNVVPVSYASESVTILSGVNSGGKTSLLELLGQCLILAHMGFPVPAESFEMSALDEFYYFGKSKGTLDAGAFETTLRNFSSVLRKNKRKTNDAESKNVDVAPRRKAIFADELEAITEPGASAKIIAGLLEAFSEDQNTLSLFVSHLAEPIAKNCSVPVQIDGIEADGLDENLNLIVNRSPVKNHIAKSTPELIVEKLFLTASGEDAAFYERLKKKF